MPTLEAPSSASRDPALLEARRLKVGLDSDSGLVRAVDDLSLTIERGRTFALVGESGCGKSMTALALLRLLPESGRILEGEIELHDAHGNVELVGISEGQMRALRGGRIGIIFQEPATSLNPVMRIGEQIVEAIEAHTTLHGKAARSKAVEWLTRVGIPDAARRMNDYPFQMSGGQKQRVMIAIALAAEPKLLIADEPTTALDVTIQAQILDLLAGLQREFGMAMLLITHDLAVVSQYADHVALMYAGQIVESASAQTFFSRPVHPYARQLLQALPDAARRGQKLASIGGTVPALNQAFTGCRFADRCPHVDKVCRGSPPPIHRCGQDRGLATPAPPSAVHWVRCVRSDVLSDVAPLSTHLGQGSIGAEPDGLGRQTQMAPGESAGQAQTSMASIPLLEVKGLSVSFPIRRGLLRREVGAFKAVDDISFSVQERSTVALVGESGCGKSTTGKALLRLLGPVARVSGQINWRGQELNALSPEQLRAVRRDIQIIFQDPFASLNPRLRVGDIIDEGLEALRPHLDAIARRRAIDAMLERVGLRPEVYARFPHEFSGGQRQRIAIARALVVEPRMIICDEPTSALDVSVQAQILNLLTDLQQEFGVAYLFITHNFAVVEYFADQVMVMEGGRIVEAGDVDRVLSAPEHPYTQRLLAAVPRLKIASPRSD